MDDHVRHNVLGLIVTVDSRVSLVRFGSMRETHDEPIIIKAFAVIVIQILALPGYITILTNVLFSLSVNVMQNLRGHTPLHVHPSGRL